MSSNLKPPSLYLRLIHGATNVALFIAGLVNLCVGTWAALHGNVALSGASLTAGLVLLFAATIDRFELLKGPGIEARTRKLDQKIEQADEALHRIRELAELTGASIVDLSSKVGRMDSAPTPEEAYTQAQRVRHILESIGSDASTVRRALAPWVHISCFDLAQALVKPLRKPLHEAHSKLTSSLNIALSAAAGDSSDEAVLALRSQIEVCTRLQSELSELYRTLSIDDYPHGLLAILDRAPVAVEAASVAAVRRSVEQFAPAMVELRTRLQLADPVPWLAAVAKARSEE